MCFGVWHFYGCYVGCCNTASMATKQQLCCIVVKGIDTGYLYRQKVLIFFRFRISSFNIGLRVSFEMVFCFAKFSSETLVQSDSTNMESKWNILQGRNNLANILNISIFLNILALVDKDFRNLDYIIVQALPLKWHLYWKKKTHLNSTKNAVTKYKNI